MAVYNFLKKNSDLIGHMHIVRGLYLRSGCDETFVLEYPEFKCGRRTFVFCLNCGNLEEIRTEFNTMEKYILEIPKCEFAEYYTA